MFYLKKVAAYFILMGIPFGIIFGPGLMVYFINDDPGPLKLAAAFVGVFAGFLGLVVIGIGLVCWALRTLNE